MADLEERLKARAQELQGQDNVGRRLTTRQRELEQTKDMRVIAETGDGGKVYEAEDGSRYFSSPGYSTNDPAQIKKIMEGAKPVDLVQESRDQQLISENPVAARVQEFNQGAPIVGEWMDEAVRPVMNAAGRVGILEEGAGDQAYRNMNALSDAMERQNPGEAMGLNVLGGIAYTAPVALAGAGQRAANFVGRGRGVLGKGLRASTVAAPGGIAEGASSFAGRAEKGQRTEEAVTGGVVGGGLAATLGMMGPLAAEGVKQMVRRLKRLDVSDIASEFGISKPAARVVKGFLAEDDLSAAADVIRRNGDDAMLADAGPSTQQALDTAMSTGGGALRVGREAIEPRAARANARLTGVLDDVLGDADGIRAASRELSQSTARARDAAYSRAYRQPIDYASDAGRKIEAVIDRIPSRYLRRAIQLANERMQADGRRNMQILADIADDGSVTFREMPNVQQLDYIKRGLGDVVEEGTDSVTGRLTPEAQMAQGLARDLRDATAGAVPEYTAALRLGGDNIANQNALKLGRDLFSRSTTVETVRDMFRGASEEMKQAARRGLRENIEETLSHVRRTITDPNTDAREAMQLVKDFSSRANKTKLRLILGQADADRLLQEIDRASDALALRGAVARNSQTAIRQSGQQAMQDEVSPGVVRRTVGNMGNPLEAGREISQTIAAIDPRSLSRAEREYFNEIAQALVGIRGEDAQRALKAVRRAMARQEITDQDARLIGRVVAESGLGGLRQLPEQFQQTSQ